MPYNWGGTAFPSGTAVVDADGIPVPTAGKYDITFNKITAAYSFTPTVVTYQVISIIGDATPGAWDTDTDMTTTDGIIYTLNGVSLKTGALKFRGDHKWDLPYNWGGTAFLQELPLLMQMVFLVPTAWYLQYHF